MDKNITTSKAGGFSIQNKSYSKQIIMKVKLGILVVSQNGLSKIVSSDLLSIGLSFRMKGGMEVIEKKLTYQRDLNNDLVRKYGTLQKDKDGNDIPDSYNISPANKDALDKYVKEMTILNDEEVEVPMPKLPLSLVESLNMPYSDCAPLFDWLIYDDKVEEKKLLKKGKKK
jgi:hypothetical protein